MQRRLHVKRGEASLRHEARKRRGHLFTFEHGAAVRGAHGKHRAAAEQRLLLGVHERHAHLFARLDGGVHQRLSPRAAHNLAHLDGGRLALRLFAHQLQHARKMRIEAVLRERLGDGLGRKRRERCAFQVKLEVKVAHDGGHLAAGKRRFAVFDHALFLLALQLVDVLVDALQVAVGRKQLRRRFVADAGHAGDVVGAVAFEPQKVGELLGAHAVAVAHLRRPVNGHVGDALARGDHVRQLGAQLVDVLIARHQKRAVAQRLVARRHRAQDVVAFPALHAHHGDVHGFKQLFDDGELHFQRLVHGRALRLILLKRLHAKRGAAGIERAHDGVGLRNVDELQQHSDEAEHGVGGRAVRRVHGKRHGVERAVHKRVAIDDGYLFLGHGSVPFVDQVCTRV